MAVTIDATKGGVSANSYATAAEADAFLDTIYGADEWASVTADDKGRLLITATRQLDRLPIDIEAVSTSQRLAFPVKADPDGFDVAKEACILQAFYLFQNADALTEAKAGQIQGVKSESLGPTNKAVTGFNAFKQISSEARSLLTPYIDFSFKFSRG